jgi:glycosyltransferase involved in cell wall biosynthesis
VAGALQQRLSAGSAGGILMLPAQTWFSAHFQRPQQMARALAASGIPVVYCEPWRYARTVIDTCRVERQFVGIKDIGERLHLLRWPTVELHDLIVQAEPRNLLMLWPWQLELFPEESPSRVIYEVIDDQEFFADFESRWMKQHLEWVEKADVLVATADDLVAQLKPLRDDVLLLPNAVALNDWQHVGQAELPADLAAARSAERIIAYYGALGPWFDWPLWIHAAKARPDWSFVLIGPPYDGDMLPIRTRAAEAPNIHYLGPKQYRELPGYLRYFDVATIPFLLNSITHACSPVKLFEYMAAGKPIVTTAMREVLKYKSVLVAHSPEDFVERLDQALAMRNDPAYQSLLRIEAEQNTWESRAAGLIEALREAELQYGSRPRRAALQEMAR